LEPLVTQDVMVMSLVDILVRLVDDIELYADLLRVSESPVRVGFELTDTGERATLVIADSLTVEEGAENPTLRLILTRELLERALRGEVDLFALAGRSRMDEKRPVDFEFTDRERVRESMECLYRLATFFLIPGRVKTRALRVDLAGTAHGARPIPLVYWRNLRTAWYHVPSGSVLNEAGETDPWPQAFIVLRGSGQMVIGNFELDIEPQRVYYVPRNITHQIRAADDVELIWLAWDAPAFA